MTKINSKNKGSRFERQVCKFFTKWTGYEFSRVPASGGLRWKKTDNITADITCTDDKHSRRFLFSVECKSYNDIRFEHILLGNKSCKILSFWEQANNDANRSGKIPLLVMKYNNMPKDEAFVVVQKDLFNKVIVPLSNKFKKPVMAISMNKDNVFMILMLSDLMSIDYNIFHKNTKMVFKVKK